MGLARVGWLSWSVAVLPLLGLTVAVAARRARRDWRALGQGGRPARDGSTLWVAASACLFLALAGPRWGRSDAPPLPPGHDVVIAVDVSRSMAARDAVPDRLGLAVGSAVGLVEAIGKDGGDRVAVVAFAGRGVLRCPLTRSLGAAVEALRALKAGEIRPGGTDLGAGLEAAVEAFDDLDHAGGGAVFVFSDGEDHAGQWAGALARAERVGVIVHAVALGDPETGHTVPADPGKAGSDPLRYRGAVVLSRRSDGALSALARGTGGAFVPLGLATTDLGRLYRTRIEPGPAPSRRFDPASGPAERFPWFLALALILAVSASWPGGSRRHAAGGWLALVLLGAGGSAESDVTAAVADGRAAYASGRFSQALDAFRRAAKLAPKSPVPAYNVAATLFRLGRYDEARATYAAARPLADAVLRTKIDYALGNSALALDDLPASILSYDDCLASTATGRDLVAIRRDAAVNRRIAEARYRREPPPPSGAGGNDTSRPLRREPGAHTPDDAGSRPTGRKAPSPSGGRAPGAGGAGGAGGDGPPPTTSVSPAAFLERALTHVREACTRRIEEAAEADGVRDGKDW